MIENLQQGRGPALGFAVHGLLTAADTQQINTQLDQMIGNSKRPIGLLADLSQMQGADSVHGNLIASDGTKIDVFPCVPDAGEGEKVPVDSSKA
jgi:hypothetical protein